MTIFVNYAYPSSLVGGKLGCFYLTDSEDGAPFLKVALVQAAVLAAVKHVKHNVVINYGDSSMADPFRYLGNVSHALD